MQKDITVNRGRNQQSSACLLLGVGSPWNQLRFTVTINLVCRGTLTISLVPDVNGVAQDICLKAGRGKGGAGEETSAKGCCQDHCCVHSMMKTFW